MPFKWVASRVTLGVIQRGPLGSEVIYQSSSFAFRAESRQGITSRHLPGANYAFSGQPGSPLQPPNCSVTNTDPFDKPTQAPIVFRDRSGGKIHVPRFMSKRQRGKGLGGEGKVRALLLASGIILHLQIRLLFCGIRPHTFQIAD